VPVHLDHTIVAATDAEVSARWYADVLGLDAPVRFGPFWQITTANGVNLDFDDDDFDDDDGRTTIPPRHFAFLITEGEFDAVFGRITARGIEHFADPMGRRRGEINRNDGGRGAYFPDPDGHWLEIITRPYGAG